MDVRIRRKNRFFRTGIIMSIAFLLVVILLLLDLGKISASLKKYSDVSARISLLSGDASLVEDGAASALVLKQLLRLDTSGYLLLTQGSRVTVDFPDGSSAKYDGPLMLPLSQIYHSKIQVHVDGKSDQKSRDLKMLLFLSTAFLFFMLWLRLCYIRSYSLRYPFYITLLSSILFGMALLFVKGKIGNGFLSLLPPLSAYLLVFLISLKLLKSQEIIPEAESLETRTNDLLYEGLQHFDAGRMEEAYKLFSKAQSLSPERPDVKNLVGIMEMKINDPEKLERIAVLKRKLDNSFKKKLQTAFQRKETIREDQRKIGTEV